MDKMNAVDKPVEAKHQKTASTIHKVSGILSEQKKERDEQK